MAKKSTNTVKAFSLKSKKKRKGIHAKTKQSKNKNSKNYFKKSRGQNS